MKSMTHIPLSLAALLTFSAFAADMDLTQRRSVEVTTSEYNHVLGDMQKMLIDLSQIQSALSKNDWAMVEKIAYAQRPDNTMGSPSPASVSFHAKIPPEWRNFGRPMHQGWQALYENAKVAQNKDLALDQMAKIGQSCAGCHATFQLKLNAQTLSIRQVPAPKSDNTHSQTR